MSLPPNMNPARGQTFTRFVKALGVAKGITPGAISYAQSQNWSNVGAVVESIKAAAVTQVGTDDIVPSSPAAFDLAEFIRPMTIIGKLPVRRVPSRTRVISATSGSTAYWAGERNPRPISRLTFEGDTLELLSIIAVLVTTVELLRSSAPSAESILSRDLARAIVQAMDEAFISSFNSGTAGVKPASITYGTTPIHSAGSTLANIDADLALLIQALSDAGSDLAMATFVMKPRTALYLSRLRGTGENLAYPGMGVKGGVLLGLPAIVSAGVPTDVGSPQTNDTSITLLDPSEILVADDGGGAIEIGRQTSIDMQDTPGSPVTHVSMWQSDAAALKVSRYANWERCRDGMAQVLDQVAY